MINYEIHKKPIFIYHLYFWSIIEIWPNFLSQLATKSMAKNANNFFEFLIRLKSKLISKINHPQSEKCSTHQIPNSMRSNSLRLNISSIVFSKFQPNQAELRQSLHHHQFSSKLHPVCLRTFWRSFRWFSISLPPPLWPCPWSRNAKLHIFPDVLQKKADSRVWQWQNIWKGGWNLFLEIFVNGGYLKCQKA